MAGWYRPWLLVSDTTLETPHTLPPEGKPSSPPAGFGPGGRAFLSRYAWWFVGLGVVLAAAITLRWANTRPGYDPYGWLNWGYHTLRGTLDLGGAPSWKPFTFIFTVVYALFGHWALYLWMLTAVSISFSGAVFGGRIAYRARPRTTGGQGVAGPRGRRRALRRRRGAGHPGLLPLPDERPVRLNAGRRVPGGDRPVPVRAPALGLLAGRAGRTGPPRGVAVRRRLRDLADGVKRPDMRRMVIAGGVITLFLWFGVPTITNGRP